jgi:hypothetical protein
MRDTIELCKAAGFPLMSFEGVTYVSPELERLVAFVRADERAAPVQEPVAWWDGKYGSPVFAFERATPGIGLGNPDATPLYTTPPAAPDLQAELDATNRQVEILSDALAESRREVDAMVALARADEREACAKVCDDIGEDLWSLYKGRAPYTGKEEGRADMHVQGKSDGADECAAAIRARGQA